MMTSNSPVAGTLLRGLAILDVFSPEEPVLGVMELSRRLSLHKSTVSRIAATLERAGYLERTAERGKYRIGAKLARIAAMAPAPADVRRVAAPWLHKLVQACGETAHLGVLEGWESVTVDFVDGLYTIRMHTTIGRRVPAHCSAIGKAILADLSPAQLRMRLDGLALEPRTPQTITDLDQLEVHLREVRRLGYSYDDQELEYGLRCIGAPVFGATGLVIAAISVSGPTSRIHTGTVASLGRQVKAAAAGISMRLGAAPKACYWGAPPPPDALERPHTITLQSGA